MANNSAKTARKPQTRGIARREKLVKTTIALLNERDIADLTLADIAAEADIPIGSVYHFFPGINSLYSEVVQYFGETLDNYLLEPFEVGPDDKWARIIEQAVDRGALIYRENPAFAQIILSGKAPPELKLADRENDREIGRIILQAIQQRFEVPDFDDLDTAFFHMVEITDLMLSLSVMRDGEITPTMITEAKRAGLAYIRTWLPEYLPQKNTVQKSSETMEPTNE